MKPLPSTTQLPRWKEKNKDQKKCITTAEGILVTHPTSSITVGQHGPIVLYDSNLNESLAQFNRERLPERVVHAKGSAAFGHFEVTNDITKYTTSKIFELGKKTPIAVRFSRVAGSLGSADTDMDPRGFAIKFYSEEGNWDLVGNNTPIFFIRDPILFPQLIHSQKPNPVTNLREWNQFWDFLSLRQESVHQLMFLFSDRGIPQSYRHMHGYGSHTFSFVDKDQKLTYCKFHYKTDQGIKNLSPAEAQRIAGEDPNYYGRDLYDAIENKNYPSWTLYVQLMTPEQAKTKSYDPFDITKVWPHSEQPLIKVGRLLLNKNPSNYFAEVEQLAFSPSNITPGIWISPDRLLQGRLISYPDAHRYRLGTNYAQLPINCPFKVSNYQRDGASNVINQGGAPNYYPNSFSGPIECPHNYPLPQQIEGKAGHYDTGTTEDDYKQANIFYNKILDAPARGRLEDNLVSTFKKVTNEKVKNNVLQMFSNVDQTFGNNLKEKLRKSLMQEGS
ncbi:catalase-like [Coccinella septempunctata]|uniref:catalase-like n=1 Tax=Coccinella septempunctata TaxID=41139 RepID=UPI001D05D7F6|nr:catalase-like [Coccinella septempunctata]